MDTRQQTLRLLASSGASMMRTKRHCVYRLPNGTKFTVPKTASDRYSWDNALADLRIALGLSLRGRQAVTGERSAKRKPGTSQKPSAVHIDPAPIGFTFKEKMRAAIKGEKLTREEAPQPARVIPDKARKLPTIRRERERQHGAVRLWTPEEIQAANTAMRMGKLNEFMQEHHRAVTPTIQPTKESTMLTVEQIEETIKELTAGMEAAENDQKAEADTIFKLNAQIAEAHQRQQAASDRYNSLNDVKTTLSVFKGDIERVRPMLGHVSKQPLSIQTRSERSVTPRGAVQKAVKQILESASAPMGVVEIHSHLIRQPGCQTVSRNALSMFFSKEVKKNGAAIARRVGAGTNTRYVSAVPDYASAS